MSNQASLGDISENSAKEESPENSGEYFRFPIPSEWEIRPMSKIGDVQGGSTPKTGKEEYWGGGIPWLTPTEVTESRKIEISETERNITEEGYDSTSTHLMPENSLLLTTRATIGSALINKVPMCTNQGFQNIDPEDDVNTLYLYYQVRHAADYLDSLGSGSTFNEISKSMLKNVELPVPGKDEQRRIASVLYNVDQAISKTEELIEQTQRVKKGLVQDIFDKFDGENVKLEDVAEKKSENIKPKNSERDRHVGLEHIKPEEMYPDFENISNVKSTKRPFNEDEVLFAKLRPNLEKAAYANFSGLCSSDIFVLMPDDSIDSRFLYHRLNTKDAFDHARRTSAGTRMPRTSWNLLSNLKFKLPEKENQERIVEILEEYDKEVTKLKLEKEQLQRVKKGLMQDLLTGEIRTNEKVEVLDEVIEVEG